MEKRLFTSDKNYILKEAQFSQKEYLLKKLVLNTKQYYLHEYNPLGIVDETIRTILEIRNIDTTFLDHFYYELSGIYRFKYGKNQLEFLFDGDSHLEKYTKDWECKFHKWTHDFLTYRHFVRAVLEGAFLDPTHRNQHHVEIRLKLFLEQYFGLRVYVYYGIRKIKAA